MTRVQFIARIVETGDSETNAQRLFAPLRLLSDRRDGQATVWVATDGRRRAERRTVQLGDATAQGWIEIRGGLNAGDGLIDDPSGVLKPGQRIRVTGETND